ncbi:unnamed protein product [Paramecium pentaurelia]|uniref:Transmembrane protein n=1 Tax=Paramecium pentaurelia TaxID=43138 RepID=A0A8S1T4I1_9CILI|nr:unnamed protein product [Paramecium pentaurelia]
MNNINIIICIQLRNTTYFLCYNNIRKIVITLTELQNINNYCLQQTNTTKRIEFNIICYSIRNTSANKQLNKMEESDRNYNLIIHLIRIIVSIIKQESIEKLIYLIIYFVIQFCRILMNKLTNQIN